MCPVPDFDGVWRHVASRMFVRIVEAELARFARSRPALSPEQQAALERARVVFEAARRPPRDPAPNR